MKKVLMCLLMITLLVGCTKTQNNNDVNYDSKIRVHYEGVDVSPGQKFNSSDIKKEASVYKTQSCAFDGEDKIYNYGNIEITTNVRKGYELIYSVYILDNTLPNDEKIKLNDDIKKVKEAYGDKYNVDVDDGIYTVSDDVLNVIFIETDGAISSIEYSLIIEE